MRRFPSCQSDLTGNRPSHSAYVAASVAGFSLADGAQFDSCSGLGCRCGVLESFELADRFDEFDWGRGDKASQLVHYCGESGCIEPCRSVHSPIIIEQVSEVNGLGLACRDGSRQARPTRGWRSRGEFELTSRWRVSSSTNGGLRSQSDEPGMTTSWVSTSATSGDGAWRTRVLDSSHSGRRLGSQSGRRLSSQSGRLLSLPKPVALSARSRVEPGTTVPIPPTSSRQAGARPAPSRRTPGARQAPRTKRAQGSGQDDGPHTPCSVIPAARISASPAGASQRANRSCTSLAARFQASGVAPARR